MGVTVPRNRSIHVSVCNSGILHRAEAHVLLGAAPNRLNGIFTWLQAANAVSAIIT